LGATVNMDGTALYECVVAIFVFQAFGIELSFTQQFLIVFTALLTSIGVAGIPSASLIAIMIILRQVGLPEAQATAGLAMVLVVDRVLDMCRTSLNVFSDSCGAVIIARSEGEEGVLAEDEGRPAG
jgi:proton glutamate symport protein